jgi:hypothetical protein
LSGDVDGIVVDVFDDAVDRFDAETSVEPIGPNRWRARPSDRWNIGDTANGGYAVSAVLRVASAVTGSPDPWSVTTHFLAPLRPNGDDAEVEVEVVKAGRTASVVRGRLHHDDRDRLEVLATFGDLTRPSGDASVGIDVSAPSIPPPSSCVDRAESAQGVDRCRDGSRPVSNATTSSTGGWSSPAGCGTNRVC